jgi:hypothetical protein
LLDDGLKSILTVCPSVFLILSTGVPIKQRKSQNS